LFPIVEMSILPFQENFVLDGFVCLFVIVEYAAENKGWIFFF